MRCATSHALTGERLKNIVVLQHIARIEEPGSADVKSGAIVPAVEDANIHEVIQYSLNKPLNTMMIKMFSNMSRRLGGRAFGTI